MAPNPNTHFWCVVLCHLLPATPPPPLLTTTTKPTNQQSNQQSIQQRIIEILYIISSPSFWSIASLIFLGQRIAAASQCIVRQDFDGPPTNGAQTRAVVGPVQAHAATITARHSMPTCPTLPGRCGQEDVVRSQEKVVRMKSSGSCQEVVHKKVCQNKDRFNRRGKLHGQKNNRTRDPTTRQKAPTSNERDFDFSVLAHDAPL